MLVTSFPPIHASSLADDTCPSDVCFCFAMEDIECTDLFLRKVPKFSNNSTNITYSEINLSNNRFRYIGPDSFRNLHVQTVKIWRNGRRYNLTFHSRAFRGLEDVLQKVDIRKNNIPQLPVGLFKAMRRLEMVDMSENQMELIRKGMFGSRGTVESLRLEKNLIKTVDEKVFSSLSQLRELSLSKNSISHVDSKAFVGLRKLEYLNLRFNRIRDLQPKVFSNLESLGRLDLSHNDIPALFPIMFKGLKNLESLLLSSNPIILITRETFATMLNLKELRLDKTKLTHMKPGIFDGLVNLRSVFLRNSGIRSIPNGLFTGLKSLTNVQLELNELITLGPCSFDFGFRRLMRVDVWLTGNPIHCDCAMAWSSRSSSMIRIRGPCKTPGVMEGSEIAEAGKYRVCDWKGSEECRFYQFSNEINGFKKNWVRIH